MLLFKRNIKDKTSTVNPAVTAVYDKWKAFKQKLAIYLQHKSDLLSIRSKKYGLIFFCFLFGGSSIAIIIHAALTKEKAVQVARLSKPAHINDNNVTPGDSIITRGEYESVMRFKNSLLHLKDDPSGRKKFDSIMQARPQLMDSIALFEKLYLSQK